MMYICPRGDACMRALPQRHARSVCSSARGRRVSVHAHRAEHAPWATGLYLPKLPTYTHREAPIRQSRFTRPSPPRQPARPPVSSPTSSSLALPRSPPRCRRRRAASARRWRSKQATPPETGRCGMLPATGRARVRLKAPPCRRPRRRPSSPPWSAPASTPPPPPPPSPPRPRSPCPLRRRRRQRAQRHHPYHRRRLCRS